jgi:two-component system cell cycle response regulator
MMTREAKSPLLKVLVCDDDPADRKLIRTYVRQLDDREIVLLEAGETAEIQKVLDTGRIDLVLMDIQMPEKSGIEWLEEIVEKGVAPVVMLTGYGSEDVAVEAMQRGASGYIPKSKLSQERLLSTIDNAVLRWNQLQQSRANQEDLERMANYDSLTGLYNRRALLQKLDEQIQRSRRYEEPLSAIMLDIDHFKKVNDRYGHIIGDNVLEKVAAVIGSVIRATDVAGRYGGEEFIIILPHAEWSEALIVAERIRKAVEAAEMQGSSGETFSITVSQGVGSYTGDDDIHSLIQRADAALYKAKENGRNRVEFADGVSTEV